MTTEIVAADASKLPEQSAKWASRRLARTSAPRFNEANFSFADLWRIMRMRRGLILTMTAVVFALAVAYTLVVTPRYQSTAVIQFNDENADSLNVSADRNLFGDLSSTSYGTTQMTQVRMLESDTLALQVVKELGLENRREFQRRQSLTDYFRILPNEAGLPIDRAPYRRNNVIKAFHKNLKVEPVPGTRMIEVEFLNPDANMAATVVNKLVADYKDQNFENRYEATLQSSDWLSKQLSDLRGEVETSQQKLVDYQKQVGLLGSDETHNITMSRLEDVNRQLMTAESNRILTQAVLQLIHDGNPELIPGLATPAISSGSSLSKESLAPLENLRAQKRQLDIQYAEDSTKYGAAHPKLVELESERNATDAAIDDEVKRLTQLAQNDYLAAKDTEDGLRASFEDEKDAANKLNDSAIQYGILKHEFESNRDLYDGLVGKLKEAGLLAGLRSTNTIIVDPARSTYRPARPIIPLNLALGMFGGLLLGVGAAFVAENMDDAINTPDDAESAILEPTLGIVPQWKRTKLKAASIAPSKRIKDCGVMVISQARSQPAEAFRAIRTSILQSIRPNVSTTILVTSALPGEGKTTVSMNTAAAFAQQGSRVLLVEADLRRPKIAAQLNLSPSAKGLTSLIRGEACPELPIKLPMLPYLSAIPAGPQSPYPAELLGSDRMKALIEQWHTEYDYIIFDTPPALSVTDAVVLSSACEVVVLVAKSGVTTRQSLSRAHDLFERSRPRILGVVVNGLEPGSPYYSSYYGYDNNSELNAGYYAPIAQ